MKVKNVEADIRFRYNEAASASNQLSSDDSSSYYTDNSETQGITNLLNKAATNAGLLS